MGNINVKIRKRTYYFSGIILFTLFFNTLKAQTLQDSIISYFNILQAVPQEKLYLHIDKPFYGAGENIWFKGYLCNMVNHQEEVLTNYIITELIDRKDSLIMRKKIRRDSIGFYGNFELPATLKPGNYYLRGYTNWMLNQEPDFFYSRPIQIGNSIDISIISSIEYYQEDKGNYLGKIKFTNQENRPFQHVKLTYTLHDKNKTFKKRSITTNEEGIITVPLPNLSEDNKDWVLDVELDDSQWIYKNSFYLPNRNPDFDVQFFPEGGTLLQDVVQRVAFKMQKANGLGGNGKGVIVTSNGETKAAITTEHAGMGIFSFTPKKGESYFAEIISEDGLTKRFSLPEPKDGFSIALYQRKEEIMYKINKTEETSFPNSFFLIAHSRGKLSVIKELTPQNMSGKISTNFLPEGVNHFLLVDNNGYPVSERLCFIRHKEQAQISVFSDKEKYDKREKVSLQIKGIDKQGMPLTGNFSVSITDAGSVIPDSLSNNILSNLLLTADLKGYIEDPGYYFLSQDNKKRENNLDLLMLTHGWRRFDLSNLKGKPVINTIHFIEQGQSISGRIKGFFGGKVKEGPIIAMSLKPEITQTVTTDKKGEFVIEGLHFPDTTTFVIQARTKRGFAGVDILIDAQEYAKPYRNFPFPEETIRFMDDYLVNTREKYYYEGGMQVINMKEVLVTAERKRTPLSPFMEGIAANTINSEEMERLQGLTIYQILSRTPGVNVINNEIQIRGNSNPPSVVVDDINYGPDTDILDAISVTDIQSINIIKGAEASIYGSANGGVIYILLKSGADNQIKARPMPGIITVNLLGYTEAAEFYHPTYETLREKRNPKPDLRTTLYWSPSLSFDADGAAFIEYYTSDNSTIQNIEIEGIDPEGNICRYFGKVTE